MLSAHAQTGDSGVATVEEAEQGLSRRRTRPRKNPYATLLSTEVQRAADVQTDISVKKYIICANALSVKFTAGRRLPGADHPRFFAADRLRRPTGAARPLWR